MNAEDLIREVEEAGGELVVADGGLRYRIPEDIAYLLIPLRTNRRSVAEVLWERELHSLFPVWCGHECCIGLVLTPLGELHVHFAEWLFRRGSGLVCNRVVFERMLLELQVPVVDGLVCGIALRPLKKKTNRIAVFA